jgi:hypothetical protein
MSEDNTAIDAEVEQLKVIVAAFEALSPDALKRTVEYIESRFNGGRLQAIERAAITVFNGLNRRIEVASAMKDPVPVFEGIAALSDALHSE